VADKAEHTSADARERPSLTRSSGDRPSGFLPITAWWLVRSLEPIGYVAAAAIGLGLWILLGDYLTGLPDVVTLAMLVASAAALWWAAWVVGNYPFAETWRLGNAIYAAAIGTTGWIAWVAAERLDSDARFTLTAGIVAVLIAAIRSVAAGDALLAPTITRRLLAEFARRPPPGDELPAELEVLTTREVEVLRLIASGLSNAEIGLELYISGATVKTHVSRLLTKLRLRDRAQAVVFAYESGLERPGS